VNPYGPEIEQTTPSPEEVKGWLRFAANELRPDLVGQRARAVLVRTLDEVSKVGEWCDCNEHREAVNRTCKRVWRNTYS